MALPLHVVCATGKKNSLKKIIDSVPLHVLETKDEMGKTPLMLSVMHNQLECSTLLLKAGVHIDNSDNLGQTALHIATNKGFHRAVKLLLSYNASCQQKDFYGVTPLHLAAIHTNPKCLIAMLKEIKPGEIDIQDSSKKTPLHWSTAYSNIENTLILLTKHANICIPDETGKTPLHWAATSSNSNALECVKILLEQEGSLINWQAYDGRSALHLAVATGSVEVVRFLVGREDCDVDILDNTFCTPLHWAAKKGFSEKVDVLLSARAFHTSADDNGATALHYAASNNHAKTMEVFLSRNYVCADDIVDANGRNAFMWAAARNALDVVKVMAIKNAANFMYADKEGITALHAAAIQGHEEIIEFLLNHQVPIELKDKYSLTPLLRACEFGRSKAALTLINHGANIYEKDANNRSAVHWCAIRGHAYLCQALLFKGVDCNSLDSFGMTPLHYACKKGYLNCVSVLLEAKAQPNIADGEGKMPLHLAILGDNLGVAKLLCEYDADVNAATYTMAFQICWKTPLDLALTNNNMEMVKLLRQYGAFSYKEIEEIAATKIQVWFCNKSGKFSSHTRKKHFPQFESLFEKRNDITSNTALLKACQHVIDTFNTKSFIGQKNIPACEMHASPSKILPVQNAHTHVNSGMLQQKFNKNFCENIVSSLVRNEKTQSLDRTNLTKEARAACIIQRTWRRYILKKRFKKMRSNIRKSFKTIENRNFAERLWQIKLYSFLKQM
ncbi:inversin [Trichonephila inaurata madagascariensis]|uniref:Alpha-latrotoxin n=1 Tax=Trichonephila inaurata madagascariensis TaxID=2747483 RepID=A0A8X6WT29_9ARAC|nr:inversin [Trichonephila inaurata madagascariensis]